MAPAFFSSGTGAGRGKAYRRDGALALFLTRWSSSHGFPCLFPLWAAASPTILRFPSSCYRAPYARASCYRGKPPHSHKRRRDGAVDPLLLVLFSRSPPLSSAADSANADHAARKRCAVAAAGGRGSAPPRPRLRRGPRSRQRRDLRLPLPRRGGVRPQRRRLPSHAGRKPCGRAPIRQCGSERRRRRREGRGSVRQQRTSVVDLRRLHLHPRAHCLSPSLPPPLCGRL